MDTIKRLSKIQLRTTPRRFAVQFIGYFFASCEPKPGFSQALMESMHDEIVAKIPDPESAQRYWFAAYSRTSFLVALYEVSFMYLVQQLLSSFELSSVALALTDTDFVASRDLFERLENQHYNLSLALAVVDRIEKDYLRAPVLPKTYRDICSTEQKTIEFAVEFLRSFEEYDVVFHPPSDLAAMAQVEITAMINEVDLVGSDGIEAGGLVWSQHVLLNAWKEHMFTLDQITKARSARIAGEERGLKGRSRVMSEIAAKLSAEAAITSTRRKVRPSSRKQTQKAS